MSGMKINHKMKKDNRLLPKTVFGSRQAKISTLISVMKSRSGAGSGLNIDAAKPRYESGFETLEKSICKIKIFFKQFCPGLFCHHIRTVLVYRYHIYSSKTR
jgi:hypothetical protein